MSEIAAGGSSQRRVPRWLWVILIASLAANLFVVGVVARAVWPSRYASANRGPGGLLGNLLAYTRSLPPERRDALKQATGQERPFAVLRPLREEIRAARQEAARLFAAEPFDRAAFLAAESRLQAVEAKLRQAVVQTAAELAGHMTAQERAGFLKWRELRGPMRGPPPHAEGEPESGNAPKKPAP
jgi:uncharacterized membrane protein